MSHEGTTGMLAEVVPTGVQAIVQALVSEANTPAPGSVVSAASVKDGERNVAGAMQAVRVEVEQATSELSVSAPLTSVIGSHDGKDDAPVAAVVATQGREFVAEAQEGTDMVGTAAAEKVQTKTIDVKNATRERLKVAKAKKAAMSAKRAKSKAAKKSIARGPVADAGAKVRKAKTTQAPAAMKFPKTKPPHEPLKFTVPEVWRSIVKKNERQGSKRYDVLVCQHAVPANDNTYRTARSCPECRLVVQQYADGLEPARTPRAPRRRKA